MAFGQRLIPVVIDRIAADFPDQLCYIIPEDPDFSSVRHVTFENFANAINGMTVWLKEKLGFPRKREAICLICASDIRYFIFMCAAWKAGYKVGASAIPLVSAYGIDL